MVVQVGARRHVRRVSATSEAYARVVAVDLLKQQGVEGAEVGGVLEVTPHV